MLISWTFFKQCGTYYRENVGFDLRHKKSLSATDQPRHEEDRGFVSPGSFSQVEEQDGSRWNNQSNSLEEEGKKWPPSGPPGFVQVVRQRRDLQIFRGFEPDSQSSLFLLDQSLEVQSGSHGHCILSTKQQ